MNKLLVAMGLVAAFAINFANGPRGERAGQLLRC